MHTTWNRGRTARLFAGLLFLANPASYPADAGAQQQDTAKHTVSEVPAQPAPFTFSLTTQEVVLDVVATDRRDHPVLDLQPSDIQVFELAAGAHKLPQKITALHVIQPTPETEPVTASASAMRVSLGGCTQRYVPHYEIAYHAGAEALKSGYHEVLVTTSRHNVKLSFNHHYYVGETKPLAQPLDRTKSEEEALLLQAACYHPSLPFSIALSAHLIENATQGTDPTGTTKDALRYFITVPPASLPFLDMANNSRRVSLEYGICTFDADGKPLRFMRSPIDRILGSGEYVQSIEHGFRSRLEFLPIGKPVLARVVLHDLTTGNMGEVDIPIEPIPRGDLTPAEKTAEATWKDHAEEAVTAEALLAYRPPLGPLGSFGSLSKRSGALCGDVYELPEQTVWLPSFLDLDSVGSLYTYSLDVPHQQFWNTGGIPGVTRHTDWFGIDYHGEFWIQEPGEYRFDLVADDGAKLYIDDQQIINADGVHMLFRGGGKIRLQAGMHTIHVPYLQGPQNSVALELFVKPPGGDLELFDLRSFQPPAAP